MVSKMFGDVKVLLDVQSTSLVVSSPHTYVRYCDESQLGCAYLIFEVPRAELCIIGHGIN